jgi:hemolysin D
MSKWNLLKIGKRTKAKAAIEYLPDADEIERSPLPRYAQFTMQILLIAFAVFGAWAYFSELEKVVLAHGRLVNPLPNVVVQPLETAVIKSVDVRVGQVVKRGDTLATLDATIVRADENQIRLRLNSLETQAQRLEQELSGKGASVPQGGSADGQLQANILDERKANYRAQQIRMGETAAKLRAALATNRNSQKLLASRLRSLKELESIQENMVLQKFGAPIQLMEAQLRSRDVERELQLAANREQELLRELAAFEAEKTVFEKGWRQKIMEELLSVSRERDSVNEQLQKADMRQRFVTLVAPVDGVILDIVKLSPGSIVREAETFFTLVPLNATLEAEVQIESGDIGYIAIGHPVHIKLHAYPFQRHGALEASVRTISEDAFRKDPSAKSATDAYYVGKLVLNGTMLKNMRDGSRLLPGMTLTAEIVVGKRSILSYMAWPLMRGLGEAAREP